MFYLLRTFASAFIIVGLLSGASYGWTKTVHQEVALDAMKLSPKYMQMLLDRHQAAMLRGAIGLEMDGEYPKELIFDGTTQQLLESEVPEAIENESGRIQKLIKNPKHLPEVSYRFGRVAYLASLSGNPLNIKNADENERFYHNLFSAYVEKELRFFRVPFQGYNTELISTVPINAYLQQRGASTARFYQSLSGEFMKNGKIADIRTFNHQSVAFAVASISYKNSVSTVADLWQSIWRVSGGDLTYPDMVTAAMKRRAQQQQ